MSIGCDGEGEVGQGEDDAAHNVAFGIAVCIGQCELANGAVFVDGKNFDASGLRGKEVVAKYFLGDGSQVHS